MLVFSLYENHIIDLSFLIINYIHDPSSLQALIKLGFSLDSPAFYTVCEVIPAQFFCKVGP